jgi:hypothetical protein
VRYVSTIIEKSGGVIVMTAFAIHFLREISRTQLLSAAKRLIVNADKRKLQALDKNDFLIPLGKAFVEREIVKIKEPQFVTYHEVMWRRWGHYNLHSVTYFILDHARTSIIFLRQL